MIGRCQNPNNENWEWYGGKGVTVCERWQEFENFYADMGDPPDGKSLDRHPNRNGNYEPENCRWADHADQCENRSSTVFITHDGKSQSIARWAREVGMSESTLTNRLNRGWPPERALTEAVDTKRGNYDRSKIRANSYAEKLAAVLLLLKKPDGSPLIPLDIEEQGTKKILAHVQWDHFIPLAMGGSDHFSNLQPMTKPDHLEKTKIDIRNIAKAKRISKAQAEFRTRLLTPHNERPPKKYRWGSRPFPNRNKELK